MLRMKITRYNSLVASFGAQNMNKEAQTGGMKNNHAEQPSTISR